MSEDKTFVVKIGFFSGTEDEEIKEIVKDLERRSICESLRYATEDNNSEGIILIIHLTNPSMALQEFKNLYVPYFMNIYGKEII